MASFEPFTIVAIPFPYVEDERHERRPALVVPAPALGREHGLALGTDDHERRECSLARGCGGARPRHGRSAQALGVRPVKIATVETARCNAIGRLDTVTRDEVASALLRLLAPITAQHRG